MLIRNEREREKSLKASESNPAMLVDGAATISGCSRKHNPREKNKSHFKYAYNKEELSQYLTKNATPSKRFGRDRSNTSHLESGLVPNEN